MEKKLNNNDHKRLRNISGDIADVPLLSICIGLKIENHKYLKKSLNLMQNSDDTESNWVLKSNTQRYGNIIN